MAGISISGRHVLPAKPFRLAALVVTLVVAGIGASGPAAAMRAGRRPWSEPEPVAAVFPVPGTATVSPATTISFRGLTVPSIPDLTVVGERSGEHAGHWQQHQDGQGTSFIPDHPLAFSEVVTVHTAQPVAQVSGGTWRYHVAGGVPSRPDLNSQKSGPGSKGAEALSAVVPLDRSRGVPFAAPPARGSEPLRSRPDLHPPAVATTALAGHSDGLLFADSTVLVPDVQTGDLIYDDAGQVVWFQPSDQVSANLQPIIYRGQPALASYRGHQLYDSVPGAFGGEFVVWDSGYRPVGAIGAGNGYAPDEHELRFNAAGDKVLLIVYHAVRLDLTPYGGQPNATYLEGVVQEVEVATGAVTFEWHSLSSGGISPADSFFPQAGALVDGVHLNSANYDSDGSILVSSRSASQVLKIDRSDGRVQWRLGGKTNEFAFTDGDGGPSFPHDASRHPDGTVAVFDNGLGRQPPYSRAVSFRLDEVAKTAHVERSIRHSPDVLGPIVGSYRGLANGDDLVSWGNSGVTTEYAGADVVFESALTAGEWTYRTVRAPWHAQPARPPDIAVDRRPTDVSVHASWNGATEVTGWELLGGPDPGHLRSLGKFPRTGFETRMQAPVQPTDQVFAAAAHGADGQALARSAPMDPVAAKYVNLGGAYSFLGLPLGPEHHVGTGSERDFAGGSIYWQPGVSAFEVRGALRTEYRAVGGPLGSLGYPTSDQGSTADGAGRFNHFAHGSIYSSLAGGTHEVHGAISDLWTAQGYERGALGYPVSDEYTPLPGLRRSDFTGGSVLWSRATGAFPVR